MRADVSPVKAAFNSDWQALAFAGLVFSLLLLPLVFLWWPPESLRAEFANNTADSIDCKFLYHEIYENRADIDVLFIGASMLRVGLDTPIVQKALSQACGSEKTVLSFGHSWTGVDFDYFLLRELLSHRKVRMVVFFVPLVNDLMAPGRGPHPGARRWLRICDSDYLQGLSFSQFCGVYDELVLGAPRLIVNRIFPPKIEQLRKDLSSNLGVDLRPWAWGHVHEVTYKLKEFHPAPLTVSGKDLCYSTNPAAFRSSEYPCEPFQMHFLMKIMKLLRKDNVALVALTIPAYKQIREPAMPTRLVWPQVLGPNVEMIGVRPAQLFKDLTDEQVKDLYYDPRHFNKNGAEFFTKSIQAGIVDAYRKLVSP